MLSLIIPCLDANNSLAYQTVEELYAHLNELYADPNKVKNACTVFKKLYIKGDQTFQSFYADFLHLVTNGNITLADLKDELNNKLQWKLQETVVVYYNNPNVNLTTFAQHYTLIN